MKTQYLLFSSFLILALHFFGFKNESIYFNFSNNQKPEIDPALNSVYSLDLSNKGLTFLDEEIKKYKNLEELILDDNMLSEIPKWISELPNLKRISIQRNYNLDIFKTSIAIEKLNKLEELNISQCNISSLPYQLSNLYALKRLYASDNNIPDIPYHIGFLKNLEELKLKNNNLQDVGYVFSELPNLKRIDLSENPAINFSILGESLSFRPLEELKISHITKLPAVFQEVNTKSLSIEHCRMEEIPEWFSEMAISDLTINYPEDNCNKTALLNEIAQMKYLRSVKLQGFSSTDLKNAVPNMKQIEKLSLTDNQIENLYFLNHLKQLKNLDLRLNPILENEKSSLQNSLPNCILLTDEVINNEDVFKINPPVQMYVAPFIESTILPSRGGEINGKETKLLIPENAFLDENGKTILTPVTIKLKEYNTITDIVFSGIPMKIRAGDSLADFASAGMFEIRAESQGKEVFPNPENPIKAQITSDQNQSGYNSYVLNDKTAEWEETSSQPQVINSTPNLIFPSFSINPVLSLSSVGRPFLAHQKINIHTRNASSDKSFSIHFSFLNMFNQYNCAGIISYNELSDVFNKYTLVYNGNDAKSDRQLLDSISRKLNKVNRNARVKNGVINKIFASKKRSWYYYNELNPIQHISITPDYSTDDFLLSFNYAGNAYSFHVYPQVNSINPENIQNKNKQFYNKYLVADTKLKKANIKAIANYKLQLENYEEAKAKALAKSLSLSNKEKSIEQLNEEVNNKLQVLNSNQNFLTREFEIQRFGINNLDKLYTNPKAKTVLATYHSESGNELNPAFIYMCDMTIRGTFYLNGNSPIKFAPEHKNAVILLLDKNSIGVASINEMKKVDNSAKIKVKIFDTHESKKEDIDNYINGTV